VRAGRVAEQVSWKKRRREGIEKTLRSMSEEMRKRTDGSSALSTGSLGHSYASAVKTITAKPHLLRKMPHIRSNSSIDMRFESRINSYATQDLRGDDRYDALIRKRDLHNKTSRK